MQIWKEFLLSLVKVSGTRVKIAACMALGAVVLLDGLLRFGWLAFIPEEYLLREPRDDHVHAAWVLSHAKFLPEGITPVYILGGSGMREAITSEAELDTLVNAGAKKPCKIFLATTPYRTAANRLVALDTIPERAGILILGSSIDRFFTKHPHLLPDQLNGLSIMGRNRQLIDFLKNRYPQMLDMDPVKQWLSAHTYLLPATRVLAEKIRAFQFRPITYQQHIYDVRYKEETLRRQVESWQEAVQKKNVEFNMDLMLLSLELAKAKGHKALLVEQTLDYEYIAGRLDKGLAEYVEDMKRLSEKSGVRYADFERDFYFSSDVFGDIAHLKDDNARNLFTRKLADEIIHMVNAKETAQ